MKVMVTNMKKLITVLLLCAFAAMAVSCGGDTAEGTNDTSADTTANVSASDTADTAAPETEPADTTAVDTPAASVEGYTCVFDNGISVKLGIPAADALAILGDYSDMMEAPSCVHDGYDRVYTWSGLYTMKTSPDASGAEYAAEISLLSDLVALDASGTYLMIGSPEADVRAVFGDPAEDNFGVQKYLTEGAEISVIIDGGVVTGFTLIYPAN